MKGYSPDATVEPSFLPSRSFGDLMGESARATMPMVESYPIVARKVIGRP
jgi:hypothetical protein